MFLYSISITGLFHPFLSVKRHPQKGKRSPCFFVWTATATTKGRYLGPLLLRAA